MRHKTALEKCTGLGVAISNLKVAIFKSLYNYWIFRVLCRLFGLEEVLVIQGKKESK